MYCIYKTADIVIVLLYAIALLSLQDFPIYNLNLYIHTYIVVNKL